ncbi:PBSX family phage terminase large subunit [Brevundimonas sp.]|uniref:PBSX family phage terminase large subunit n=1 Tax=Brevundimonas sp. TaxID=1871086 RepID=UPI003784E28D
MSELRIKIAEAFLPLEGPHRYIGAHGGRGSAKSHYFGERWLRENVAEKLDVVCLRETLKSLEFSVKKLLESKIQTYNAGAYFDVQDRRILTTRGGVTIFEGMQNHTADSIKSLEGFDRAMFEEAQAATDKSLTLLRPTIRKPGSQMWFAWNPDQASDPIDKLLRGDQPPPDSAVVEVNYMDNPWLPDELRAEMEYDRGRDPDKYAHVWLGKYRQNSEARVFKNWRIEEFDTDPAWILRQGADWGFSIDPSVLVQCAIVGRTLYVIHEAYRVGCEVDFLPQLFGTVPESERWPTTADSARPETISYMQRHGFPKMLAAIKGARSLEEGVSFLQSFDIVVHPRCLHAIEELRAYSYETDPLTGQILPKLADKDNHVIDSLRYACEGARRAMMGRGKAPDFSTSAASGARL